MTGGVGAGQRGEPAGVSGLAAGNSQAGEKRMLSRIRHHAVRLRHFNRTGKGKAITAGVLVLLIALGIGAWNIYQVFFPELPAAVTAYDFYPLKRNKSWADDHTRQWYYHASQGSEIMPYDWFVALEQADNDALFINNDFMSRMRFVPDPNPDQNPDLLPIGFAKDDPDPIDGSVNAGLTCAACHTAQITYRGMGLRIDGAPGQFNFDQFLIRIVAAMGRIALPNIFERLFEREPTKFTRFAKRVLKDKYDDKAAAALKLAVVKWVQQKVVEQGQQFGSDNKTHEKPTQGGFGRLDALGNGGNRLYRMLTPDNLRVLNAPVSAFPLWYVGEYDWVQSNGSIRQPISRNVIEALAVNASIVLPRPLDQLYLSSVRLKNMWQMETMIGDLEAPVWPENILGAIDHAKADAGKVLYAKYCSNCHSPRIEPAPLCEDEIAVRNKKRYFILRLFDVDRIGTDPLDAVNFATRTVNATGLKNYGPNEAGATIINEVVGGTVARGFHDLNLTQAQQDDWSGYRSGLWRAPKAYPARPLDGTWATSPYLHNNSVPNLYELLLPAKDRATTFHTGAVEFDPIKVGFETTSFRGGFEFDTSLPGNSNAGHEFRNAPAGTKGVIGPELSDTERWQLVEYLKIISEFPAARAAAKAEPESNWAGRCFDPAKDPAPYQ